MFEEQGESRTRVKICGLTKLEHARYASGAMVDFLGFIFCEKSKRYIEPPEAAAIISWLEGPQTVGVFVDQSIDDVNDIAEKTGVDLIQLHGSESPEYCDLIQKPVIKAFRIPPGMNQEQLFRLIQPYIGHVSYFLFDTFDKSALGGTGKSFNWEILKNFNPDVPFFLAGGISISNVKKAINEVKPFAIDVSSSLEKEPGIKDFEKMEAFFEEINSIWETQLDE